MTDMIKRVEQALNQEVETNDFYIPDDLIKNMAQAAIECMDGWQPIETALKDGTEYHLYCPRDGMKGFQIMGYWNEDYDSWYSTEYSEIYQPTHYRELPEPPKETP